MSEHRITSADVGTWLDGSMGWHNSYHAIWRAREYGFPMDADDVLITEAYEQGSGSVTLSTGEVIDADTLHGCIIDQGELCDRATDYLQSLAPDGYEFVWDMGELSLQHDEECTGCEHDCPWKRTPGPIGAPFCQTCDDHMEAGDEDE